MSKRRGKQQKDNRAPHPASSSSPRAAAPRVEPVRPHDAARGRRILDWLLPLAIPTLYFILVWTCYPFHAVSEFDPDEGNNVIKALQLAKGHELYTEIWSDQPPLFTYMLRAWLGLAGWSAHQARIFVLLCSCVLLGALYQTVRPTWGHGGAIGSTILLATTWRYVALSVSAMLTIPTLMLAMLSAFFIAQYRQRRQWHWLVLSGAFLALSLFTKLFALPLAPLLALAVAYLGWSHRNGAAGRRGWLRPLGLWLASFAITAAVLFLTMIPFSAIDQLIRPHLDAGQRMSGAGWDKVYAEQLRADWLYAVFGLIGLVHVVRRREWIALVPLVWYLLAAILLNRHRPLWYHHYLLLSVPMCWMAAAALGPPLSAEVLRAWRPWKGLRSAMTVASLAVTLALAAVSATQVRGKLEREREYADQFIRMTPRDDYIAAVMRQFADSTRYVITDRQMLPFMAGLIVPPELSVTSVKRFQSGHLTIERLLELFQKYQPEQVLLSWRRRIRPDANLQAYLKANYRLIYTNVPGDLYYVGPALADNADAALEQALAKVPQSEDGWYNWGLRLAAAGRDPEAVNSFRSSVDRRPTVAAYDALAKCYDRLGKAEDAADARRKADRLKR